MMVQSPGWSVLELPKWLIIEPWTNCLWNINAPAFFSFKYKLIYWQICMQKIIIFSNVQHGDLRLQNVVKMGLFQNCLYSKVHIFLNLTSTSIKSYFLFLYALKCYEHHIYYIYCNNLCLPWILKVWLFL